MKSSRRSMSMPQLDRSQAKLELNLHCGARTGRSLQVRKSIKCKCFWLELGRRNARVLARASIQSLKIFSSSKRAGYTGPLPSHTCMSYITVSLSEECARDI